MSIFKKSKKKELMDKQIYDRVEQLDMTIGDVEEDAKEIENIKNLVECKEKLEKPKFELNWNTLISGGFGILGLMMLISHERDGVIASKVGQIVPISKFFK